ncbi:hypothetical protein [Rubripirellula lacrimiformis]|uniref:hypothetical protein n=1 Tax=Rubripirellula lacrimiformis TaxID=1930273 RepID=UPI00119E8C25|nr:hypothetical protein [Rubripirellula lacrimiformis]
MTSFAQRPPGAEGLESDRASPSDAGFFGGAGVARFQLIQGRLCLDPPRHRKGSQKFQAADVYESITVSAERGIPSLHYVYQSPHQHLIVNVKDADRVRLESWLPGESQRAVIHHSRRGPIVWESVTGDPSRGDGSDSDARHRVTGTTFLHLRQRSPAQFDKHFGELIQRILQGTSLAQVAEQAQQVMLGNCRSNGPQFRRGDVDKQVQKLRSPRRQTRAIAQRQLLLWGTPVVAVLDSIPATNLDAEQRDRLRTVRDHLRTPIPDTPRSLAKLLINDPGYWAVIADDLPASDRHLAQSRFQQMEWSVSFEPVDRLAIADPDPDRRIATAPR